MFRPPTSPLHRARWKALAAAILFSTGGVAVKTTAFSGAQVASLRALVAALTICLWFRGRIAWSLQAWTVGAVYACMTVLYVAATRMTTAAHATFLQATGPIYLLVLAPWILKERIRRSDIVYGAALVSGIVLCIGGSQRAMATAPAPGTGNVLALLCGVAWALTLVGLRRVERDAPLPGVAIASVVCGCLLAAAAAFPVAWPMSGAPASAWFVILYLGVFQIGAAYALVTEAVRHLPAFELSLLLLLEPVLNPVWTWAMRGERPGNQVFVGGAVIVTATALKSIYASRTQARLPSPEHG